MNPVIVAVSRSADYTFSKPNEAAIRLIEGIGVEGDVHAGKRVKHRHRVKQDPTQPNLRQVHLIHAELLDELNEAGFTVAPGQLGENITTRGIDLLGLPAGTKLAVGKGAVIEITGLRNPCYQLDNFQKGLTAAVVEKNEQGQLIRKAGIMGIVLAGGEIRPGDTIQIDLPPAPHQPLEVV